MLTIKKCKSNLNSFVFFCMSL